MKKTITVFILTAVILWSSALTFAQSTVQVKETGTVRFTDISGHWAEIAVQELGEKGAISFSEEKFIPGKAISRSEFAVMLHKAMGIQISYFKAPDIKDYFMDVKQEASYASMLIDLVTANILEGKVNFQPEGTLLREEMVHYIMNAYRYKLGENYKEMKLSPSTFEDNKDISPAYSGDVARAAYLKVIAGMGRNSFHPKNNTSRAEAAVAIKNLMNLLEKENQEVVVQPNLVFKENTLEMKLSIINNSKNPVTFTHSSGQKYDFVLLDSDKKELYRWSEGKFFTMMLTSSVIEAGKSIEYNEILDKDIYKEIKDRIVYLKAYVMGSSDSFDIKPEGYELKLK